MKQIYLVSTILLLSQLVLTCIRWVCVRSVWRETFSRHPNSSLAVLLGWLCRILSPPLFFSTLFKGFPSPLVRMHPPLRCSSAFSWMQVFGWLGDHTRCLFPADKSWSWLLGERFLATMQPPGRARWSWNIKAFWNGGQILSYTFLGGACHIYFQALVEFRAGKMTFNTTSKMVSPDKRWIYQTRDDVLSDCGLDWSVVIGLAKVILKLCGLEAG